MNKTEVVNLSGGWEKAIYQRYPYPNAAWSLPLDKQPKNSKTVINHLYVSLSPKFPCIEVRIDNTELFDKIFQDLEKSCSDDKGLSIDYRLARISVTIKNGFHLTGILLALLKYEPGIQYIAHDILSFYHPFCNVALQRCKMSFLLGLSSRSGANSPLHDAFIKNPLAEPKLIHTIFSFASLQLPAPPKDQLEAKSPEVTPSRRPS